MEVNPNPNPNPTPTPSPNPKPNPKPKPNPNPNQVVGWGEASRAWRERGPVGTKGALYSSPEARQMLSDRLWGARVVGERHFGSGA